MAPCANTPFINLLPGSTGSFLKTPADPHARLAVLASHIASRPVLNYARKWRRVRCSSWECWSRARCSGFIVLEDKMAPGRMPEPSE